MKCLVTGGAGFIGSHIIDFLLKKNAEVVCLDNFDPFYDPELKKSHLAPFTTQENFSLVTGDILDETVLRSVISGTDYVFHEAAQAGVRVSVENPRKSHDVNATGTLNVLRAAADAGVRKVIFASSSSVYGKVTYLPFDESHPKEPISPYGVSKLMAEQYCRVFEELYGLQTISLRYFTVYGPRMRPDLAIHIFMENALAGRPLTIFGDGTKTRDFTYIDDIVRANECAMQKGSGAYNIGGGHTLSIHQLAEKILELTGSSSEILFRNAVRGDADHTAADTARAWKDLGWKPQTTLETGLECYKTWMLSSR